MAIRRITEYYNEPTRLQVWESDAGVSPEYHLTEEDHAEINQWCIDALGYHARVAFNVYNLKNTKDVMLFKLRWA